MGEEGTEEMKLINGEEERSTRSVGLARGRTSVAGRATRLPGRVGSGLGRAARPAAWLGARSVQARRGGCGLPGAREREGREGGERERVGEGEGSTGDGGGGWKASRGAAWF
jgi:hypothetical protein